MVRELRHFSQSYISYIPVIYVELNASHMYHALAIRQQGLYLTCEVWKSSEIRRGSILFVDIFCVRVVYSGNEA